MNLTVLPLAAGDFASNPLWYATRSSGLAAFALLTLAVALGVLTTQRVATGWWPRFASQALHRNVSLLAVALLVTHVVTTVLDSYVDISWWSALIPFASNYEPLWVGLGTLAFDLLIIVALSSLVRSATGHRWWRLLHWTTYAAWPQALTHYLATGTDALKPWSIAIAAVSTVVVLAAVLVRLSSHPGERPTTMIGTHR